MKKIIKKIWARPILLLLIIICILFLPSAIVRQPQVANRLIVRALAIDKVDNEYEATVIAYIPKATQTFAENYKVISAKENTLYEAIQTVGTLAGKRVALAHTNLILVNDALCEEGLIKSFDYLIREYSLGNDTVVLNAENSAKEVLKAANDLSNSSGIALEDIATFDEENVVHRQSNIESIYSNSFAPSKSLLLSIVGFTDDGIEVESGTGSGSNGAGEEQMSAGGEQTSQTKKLANDGKGIILKEGKKVFELNKEEVSALNWAKEINNSGWLTIENYSDENFTNATITFSVLQNKPKINSYFENGRPIFEIVVKPKLQIIEVNQDGIDKKIYISEYKFPTDAMITAVNSKIINELKNILGILAEREIDVLEIYQSFNTTKTEQFQNYLRTFDNKEDYLTQIEFRIKTELAIS